MANIEPAVQTRKPDKRSKTHHGAPRRPSIVIKIIKWRDKRGMTWAQIGEQLGMTRDGACKLYHKWYPWFKEVEQ